jgi:O-antigen biosynthesis protein
VVRIAFVTPVSPAVRGNGLAHRACFWHRTLASIGEVTTIVIPLTGPFVGGNGDIQVTPLAPEEGEMPELASQAPRSLGVQWRQSLGRFDLVFAFRSYTALFAVGLCADATAPLVVDFDDDDVQYWAAAGNVIVAEQYRRLTRLIEGRASLCLSAFPRAGWFEVSNSVALPHRGTRAKVQPSGILVGNFGYDPNVEGAKWFITEVLPVVRMQVPDFELVIVGPGSEQFGPAGRGLVDDLASEYSTATVAIVPIQRGSGTRIKVLQAWAHMVPVVGTAKGLSGLTYEPGVHALVADEAVDFAHRVIQVVNSAALAKALGSAGRSRIQEQYADEIVRAVAVSKLTDMVDSGVPTTLHPVPDLDVSEVQDGLVVYEPVLGQVHHLNATAAVVFSLVDKSCTEHDLTAAVQSAYDLAEPPTTEVRAAIDALLTARLIVRRPAAVATGE